MRLYKFLAVVLLAGLVASCCPCRKTSNKRTASFVGTEWKLTQWVADFAPSRDMNNYTVAFSNDGKVSGMGDCNHFSGSFTFTGAQNVNKISINQLASTRMLCANQARENAFFESLKKAYRFDLDGSLLILSNGTERLVFEKVK